jgi:hypothetical protein
MDIVMQITRTITQQKQTYALILLLFKFTHIIRYRSHKTTCNNNNNLYFLNCVLIYSIKMSFNYCMF